MRNLDKPDVREVKKSNSEFDIYLGSNLNWSICECLIFENIFKTLHTIYYTLQTVNYTAQYKPHTVTDDNTNLNIH